MSALRWTTPSKWRNEPKCEGELADERVLSAITLLDLSPIAQRASLPNIVGTTTDRAHGRVRSTEVAVSPDEKASPALGSICFAASGATILASVSSYFRRGNCAACFNRPLDRLHPFVSCCSFPDEIDDQVPRCHALNTVNALIARATPANCQR